MGRFYLEDAGPTTVPPNLPGVIGIFLGGCVSTGVGLLGRRDSKALAHAHIDGMHKGWICFQLPEDLMNIGLLMHEYAHILTGEGHTDAWRAAMARLDQPIPRRYQKRRRN